MTFSMQSLGLLPFMQSLGLLPFMQSLGLLPFMQSLGLLPFLFVVICSATSLLKFLTIDMIDMIDRKLNDLLCRVPGKHGQTEDRC